MNYQSLEIFFLELILMLQLVINFLNEDFGRVSYRIEFEEFLFMTFLIFVRVRKK